jgi:hypothetical protein
MRIFCWTLISWSTEAQFCFLNSPENLWLKSECLVSKCLLRLYSLSMLTLCLHICTFILSKTIFSPYSSWNVCSLLTLASSFYFCQPCILFCQPCVFLGSKQFHMKYRLLIITMLHLSTLVCYKHFLWPSLITKLIIKKNHIDMITDTMYWAN